MHNHLYDFSLSLLPFHHTHFFSFQFFYTPETEQVVINSLPGPMVTSLCWSCRRISCLLAVFAHVFFFYFQQSHVINRMWLTKLKNRFINHAEWLTVFTRAANVRMQLQKNIIIDLIVKQTTLTYFAKLIPLSQFPPLVGLSFVLENLKPT